jgi:hypothetical protein
MAATPWQALMLAVDVKGATVMVQPAQNSTVLL